MVEAGPEHHPDAEGDRLQPSLPPGEEGEEGAAHEAGAAGDENHLPGPTTIPSPRTVGPPFPTYMDCIGSPFPQAG